MPRSTSTPAPYTPVPVDQAAQPAYAPDGRTIAFHAVANEQYDIFLLDLASGEISNLTNDEAYDASPAFSHDGESMVYTSTRGGAGKLIGLEVADLGTWDTWVSTSVQSDDARSTSGSRGVEPDHYEIDAAPRGRDLELAATDRV